MKQIVCDSSALISLSENCLLPILQSFPSTQFIVPEGVEKEVITNPIHSKRFRFKAIQMEDFLDKKLFQVVKKPEITQLGKEIEDTANRLLEYKKKSVKIIHRGEAETIACAKIMDCSTLLIDERTTRILIENPEQLKNYIQSRTRFQLNVNEKVREELEETFRNMKIIRSAEVIACAYEKGLFEYKHDALEAALLSLKFAGCSITYEEIEEYAKMAK